MKNHSIFHSSDKIKGLSKQPVYLAIGMFDGVHLGHQAIIKEIVEATKSNNGEAAVLTFFPHPSRVIHPENPVLLITTPGIKYKLLLQLGVGLIIKHPFTLKFAQIKAEDFLSFLKESIPQLKRIYVGDDFRYGYKKSGDTTLLKDQAKAYGIEVIEKARIKEAMESISSSRIRKELTEGTIQEANKLLGYPYFSEGTVIKGASRGKEMGYPTLNLPWTTELKPKFGVYGVVVKQEDKKLKGVANYGVRPTVTDDKQPFLEIHLFGPTDIGPGCDITVELHYFLRPERKFDSLEELKKQIGKDNETAMVLMQDI